MAFNLNIRSFFMAIILSLIVVTIISTMLSIPLKTGSSFLLIFVGVMISVIFLAAADKKIERQEIWTLLIVAILLTVSFIAIKSFIPSIFSILPEKTQEVFSVFGG